MIPEWIIAILTFGYVVATLFIVFSNNRMADATRRQVDELQRQFQAQNRPYVAVGFEDVRDGLICLSIENLGNTPARDIRVSLNEDFISKILNNPIRDGVRKFTKTAIYLSPKQKLYCCLGGPTEFSNYKDQILLLDMTYKGDGHDYQEHIEINIDGYSWAMTYNSPLGDISSYIKRISEKFK